MEPKFIYTGYYNSMGYYITQSKDEAYEYGYVWYKTEEAYDSDFKK